MHRIRLRTGSTGHTGRAGCLRGTHNAFWNIEGANVATAAVLMYRLMEEVISTGGGTHFLTETRGTHRGVRNDFTWTKDGTGLCRKDGKKLAAPASII